MKNFVLGLTFAGMSIAAGAVFADSGKPTIILVHGAFSDSNAWAGVVPVLEKDGYKVIAAATPLRSLESDSDYVSSIIKNEENPVVLVGHSYGGGGYQPGQLWDGKRKSPGVRRGSCAGGG
ncbi:esterase/lipase family protein [Burkholderia gladioli]|uniref:esterase/lipase family protein n=1 Tax=Burkholderia gladioli TaxID=28095 RepID=UPI001F47CD13|nr:alpha/beta hydrolase [Burkholderia gladioli]